MDNNAEYEEEVAFGPKREVCPDEEDRPKHDLVLFDRTGRYFIAFRISRKQPKVIMTVASST